VRAYLRALTALTANPVPIPHPSGDGKSGTEAYLPPHVPPGR
jgi:hypothetical protein